MSAHLDRLAELEQAATPGPWLHRTGPDDDWNVVQVDALRFFEASHDRPESRADAALIAESRNALPALIAVARAAQWYIECLEKVQARKVVRGLGEAQVGYQVVLARLAADPAGEEA